ncbi:B-cell receptor CD22-like isoform X2 [Cololabis saira]|uniref:B-cell receptor CD22-like isoform X2 n=1 Tax=Cololabis saira TaxID=129043 RepID=UPI002AD26907|nr:B-cell receptor CD22-like isoform X2 [Cololabis saira]
MAGALTFLLTVSLMQGVQSGGWNVSVPPTVEVMAGSPLTIRCSFEIEDIHKNDLNSICKAIWLSKDEHSTYYDSKLRGTIKTTGDLTKKDCTTTFHNLCPHHSDTYYFRLECPNRLKWSFTDTLVNLVVKENPRMPTLNPSTLEVKEGTSVSLSCSAPAACLSHPPTLTWTSPLEDSQRTLQENQDKTNIVTSVLSFTASHLHHTKTFSCTAVYRKPYGRLDEHTISLTAFITFSPKDTRVLASPSGPVPENTAVTLTCSSDANPPVKSYTWYRADGHKETVIGTGRVLTITASTVSRFFFCKAGNDFGDGRSGKHVIDVQYLPKETRVSVSPSGPVPENTAVTLTCSSDANPPVKSYTWYRADGHQETVIGTGRVLTITASTVNRFFFCKAGNYLGDGRSKYIPPQILLSSVCNTTAGLVNCSCETEGNPSPSVHWYLDGLPVNQSGKFAVSKDSLNDKHVRSIITVSQPQERDLSTLLCRSFNYLGSANHRFCGNCLQISAENQVSDRQLLHVFIASTVLLGLICVLLFCISVVNYRRNTKSQLTNEIHANASGHLLRREQNEVDNTEDDDSYVNTSEMKREVAVRPAARSQLNNGPGNAEGASKSSGENGEDVVYTSVIWKSKAKKEKNSVDMDPSERAHAEEEKCAAGGVSRNVMGETQEMGIPHNELGPRNLRKKVECEYAHVKFKNKTG